jgi:CRP/FNR family cyclic AMP-dependent transcriptional regulator
MLERCRDLPERAFAPGDVLIHEGERTGCLFILREGTLRVCRGDVEFATVTEPGSVLGEMSVLLDAPHTASVRAVTTAKVHVIERAADFLAANPDLVLPIARLLARRLKNASTYLVNLREQFQNYQNHFGMIDEVLESIMHQQDETFPPAKDLPPDP